MRVLKEKKLSRYLWRNIHLRISWIAIFIMLLILGFVVYILGLKLHATFGFRSPYTIIALIIIPLSYVLGVFTYRQYSTWVSGGEGEDMVADALKKMSDDYYLVNGAVVPPNRGDTDHIVLGKNGIFVIETKNVSGEVICDGDEWSRRKIGRGGTPYDIKIGSPSTQVKRNAKVLKDLILKHKNEIFNRRSPHIWITGLIVFTRPDVKLDINNPTVTVLRVDELCDFIENYAPRAGFNEDELKRILDVILSYST